MCLNAPKYGNGIEWVDAIGFEIERFVLEFLHKHPKPYNSGLPAAPDPDHIPCSHGKGYLGNTQWRKASEYLSEGYQHPTEWT